MMMVYEVACPALWWTSGKPTPFLYFFDCCLVAYPDAKSQ